MRLIWGMSASFCNLDAVIKEIAVLNYDLQFVCSDTLYHQSSRFYNNVEFRNLLAKYTELEVLHSIQEAEMLTYTHFDGMILAPCTANTLAKLVNGIYDNGLLMACKVVLRNQKPIVIGYASNDALGIGASNLAKALQLKNIYLVPLQQDDWINKPNSLVCDWSLMEETFMCALQHKQLQPLLKGDSAC